MKRLKRADYLGEIQILENLDWGRDPRTLVEGGIKKDEIICAISGESARIIQSFMDNEELELVIQTVNPATNEVDEVNFAFRPEVEISQNS